MKIKQHGTIPEWKLDVTCKNCNAIITLEGAVVEDIYNFSLLNDLIYKISISINIIAQIY